MRLRRRASPFLSRRAHQGRATDGAMFGRIGESWRHSKVVAAVVCKRVAVRHHSPLNWATRAEAHKAIDLGRRRRRAPTTHDNGVNVVSVLAAAATAKTVAVAVVLP